jgi:hypothetical protein
MCGIFGLINKKPRKFDYTTFCTLGIQNDIRGGDSCGVFIDGKVEYGTKSERWFESFFQDSKLISETKECSIALGHCRKASVGAISEETAQPVCLKNEEGEIDFVVIHNGTIYNYKDLAAKYIPNIDITGMTDSQVMTRIFYYEGYEVLSEYMGAAVFVIADYRTKEPTILFWQGESKVSQYGKIDLERPLWFAISDGQLVFSSLSDYFPALLRDWDIYSLAPNWLFTFDGKELRSVRNYPRTDVGQYNNIYNSTKNNYYGNYLTYNNYDKVYCSYSNLRCTINNGIFAHRNYKINEYGTINPIGQSYEIWFWEGVVLINEKCFHILESICESLGILPKELLEYYREVVLYFSAFPYTKVGNTVYHIDNPMTSDIYTGDISLPFSNLIYSMNNGIYKSCITTTYTSNMEKLLANMKGDIKLDHEIFKFLNLDESI